MGGGSLQYSAVGSLKLQVPKNPDPALNWPLQGILTGRCCAVGMVLLLCWWNSKRSGLTSTRRRSTRGTEMAQKRSLLSSFQMCVFNGLLPGQTCKKSPLDIGKCSNRLQKSWQWLWQQWPFEPNNETEETLLRDGCEGFSGSGFGFGFDFLGPSVQLFCGSITTKESNIVWLVLIGTIQLL